MNYHCYQITLRTQTGSREKFRLDIYHWGAGLAVTGRIRDIGQNVLLSSFQTEVAAAPSYFHIFFLIAFLEEAFIRNIIIILCINYIIIMYINNNVSNAVINDNFWRFQDLILLLKISVSARELFEIYWKFGHAPSEMFASSLLGTIQRWVVSFML